MTRRSVWETAFARRTYVAAGFLGVAMGVSWFTRTPDTPGWLALRTDAAGLLYAAASIVAGWNFAGGAVRAVRTLRLDMNFLMSVAIIGAIIIGEPFEAATLAVLFSVAELLERFAVDRGRQSIARLVELAPERADRVHPDGSVQAVPAADLRVGDVVRIRPGDKIPADGVVRSGISSVNEATITGESVPRGKSPGDSVFAATVNAEGSLDVEVTADAAHSTLARIVELVRQSESQRAPVERLVERFALVYTPIVTVAAIAVMAVPPLLFGGDAVEWFVRGLTLLVIACPCALVIATPVTVVSAITSAARHGVLIKGGEHLEALGGVRAMALDKTGTLTTGVLEVERVVVGPGTNEAELLRRVGAVEALSEHPLARAIVRYVAKRGIAVNAHVGAFAATPGRGVRGEVSGVPIAVGRRDFDIVAGTPMPDTGEPGALAVHAATGDGLAGVVILRDALRPESRAVVAALHTLGVMPIVMLTGDGPETAAAVAASTGVDEWRARQLPGDKVAAMHELRSRYISVGMLGDGVNDAPALAAASVGLAMGAAGSPATIETADVALMGDELARLPYAIALARRARSVIRFNIALAIGLKIVLALGAVTGAVSLAVAVLFGDLGASLVVTLNALRLARFRVRAITAGLAAVVLVGCGTAESAPPAREHTAVSNIVSMSARDIATAGIESVPVLGAPRGERPLPVKFAGDVAFGAEFSRSGSHTGSAATFALPASIAELIRAGDRLTVEIAGTREVAGKGTVRDIRELTLDGVRTTVAAVLVPATLNPETILVISPDWPSAVITRQVSQTPVVFVPEAALMRDRARAFVFVQLDSVRFVQRRVLIEYTAASDRGAPDRSGAVAWSGLRAGERVVVSGVERLLAAFSKSILLDEERHPRAIEPPG